MTVLASRLDTQGAAFRANAERMAQSMTDSSARALQSAQVARRSLESPGRFAS